MAVLLTEREERIERYPDGSIRDASIQLWYELVIPGRHITEWRRSHSFKGCYMSGFTANGNVSLTSTMLGPGAVFLDLEYLAGHRIGTYLQNQIVHWAKQWAGAEVYPVRLLVDQATPENKARRNRFYAQFGLRFDFNDTDERAGRSLPMTTTELTTVDSWRANITERHVHHALEEALTAAKTHADDLKWLRNEHAHLYTRYISLRARQRLALRTFGAAVLLIAFVALHMLRH